MSILKKLRGNATPVQIFSNDIGTSGKAALQRMQSNKPSNNKFPEKKKFVPARFYLKKNEIAQIVLIDEKFSFACKEHSLKQDNGFFAPERCISETEVCPVCSGIANAPTYDVAFLTVQDMREYKTKDGKTVSFTKKLLPVKKGDMASFDGLLQVHGSFRGIVLQMVRGSGDKETAIGKPTYVGTLTEDEMLEQFGHEARVSDKGVVIVPENDSINPWNYEKYFVAPSADELITKYGLAPRPGSKLESDKFDNDLPPWDEENLLDLGEDLPNID